MKLAALVIAGFLAASTIANPIGPPRPRIHYPRYTGDSQEVPPPGARSLPKKRMPPPVQKHLETVVEHSKRGMYGAPDVTKKVQPGMTDGMKKVQPGMTDGMKKVHSGVNDVTKKVQSGVTDVTKKVQSGVTDVTKKVHSGVNDVTKKVQSGVTDGMKNIQTGVTDAAKKAQIELIVKQIQAGVQVVTKTVQAVATDVTKQVQIGLTGATKNVQTVVDNITKKVQTALIGFTNGLQTFSDGFDSQDLGYLVYSVQETADAIKGGLADFGSGTGWGGYPTSGPDGSEGSKCFNFISWCKSLLNLDWTKCQNDISKLLSEENIAKFTSNSY